ncbi:MAG: tetratricopeptide repeat protein [Campylobacterota bacterium]|nr:tetratricopeptide repeat protein [Campylobacterota bacterium]
MNINKLIDEAVLYHQKGDIAKAKKLYLKILKQDNQNADIWHLLGIIDYQKNSLEESIQKIKKAISIYPNSAPFYSNLGLSYLALNMVDEAIKSFIKAIDIDPGFPQAYNNLANGYSTKGLVSESINYYNKAIYLNPNYPEAYYNLGNGYYLYEEYEKAQNCYNQAIRLNPRYANAYAAIALLYKKNKKFKEALEFLKKAYSLGDVTNRYALSGLYETKRELCDWEGLYSLEKELIKKAKEQTPSRAVIEPFTASQILKNTDAKIQKDLIEIYVRSEIEPKIIKSDFDTTFKNNTKNKRIKIAYMSPNFYNQASMHLVNGIFGKHNKELFEVYIYAYYYDQNSPYYINAKKDVEHFVDLKNKEADLILDKIREDEIDILIDLRSHGYRSKSNIAASKAAPIQISFVNFPGTTSNKGFDYIIVDRTLVKEDELHCYSEQCVFMPNSYISTDDKQPISKIIPAKKQLGLDEDSFIFCNFNTLYKVEPDIFAIWIKILKKVPNSVLWLLKSNEEGAENLKREAVKQGLDPKRLIFADMTHKPDHLARIKQADLFLDTLYCNAHTSAVDCLWAGVPLITVPGNTYSSRAASSILKGVGMDELICEDIEQYINKAVDLANNTDKLKKIKAKIEINKNAKTLFNTTQYVRDLEKAYTIMYKRFYSGEKAQPIYL